MNCKIGKAVTLAAALVLSLSFVSTASAQVFTGRVDVTVEDSTGGRLPGVSVDLTGPVNQSEITDAQGHLAAGLPSSDAILLAVSSGGSYVDESDETSGPDRRHITLAEGEGFEAIVADSRPPIGSFRRPPS